MKLPHPILPPAMLGILGGGQLGAMFTVAAKTMGYRVTMVDPDPSAPAAQYADVHLCAAYTDPDALTQLAKCAAVTTEFENVSADAMRSLAQHTHVSPSGDCVAIAQNRIIEKSWIRKANLETAPYVVIENSSDINQACLDFLPGILKTATLGYDGKGQIRVKTLEALQAAFAEHKEVACVLEKMVDLRAEVSVVVCRLNNEAVTSFPVAENIHIDGILAYSTVPARIAPHLLTQAQEMAIRLANELDYQGVMAVEIFVVGDEAKLVINEIAPRPHNSGHYTLDACVSNQFQQQVRMMCGLKPAATDLLMPCTMANILGDVWPKTQTQEPNWLLVLDEPKTHLHLYGKKTARIARKMGHFTVMANSAEQSLAIAQQLHQQLSEKSAHESA